MIRLVSLLALLAMSHFGLAQDWVQLSSPTGNGRHHPITVANDQYAYVLAGQAGFAALNLADVHRYDPASDTWEELGGFPGGGRGYGYGVCEGDDAYVGFGSNDNGYPTDFWHLDMATGAWTPLLKEMLRILKLQRPVIWPTPNFYCARSRVSENWPRR